MPLSLLALPNETPYDAVEDPPGSIDPLGTLPISERLADLLLPGFTARMYRARFLTFCAVSAMVADRVASLLSQRGDARVDARLAFERLFVYAVVRAHEANGTRPRQLPGTRLARTALLQRQPLTKNNFLKAQSVNGPFGLVARLARHLEILDTEDQLGRTGLTLMSAWSADQKLREILDPQTEGSSSWTARIARVVARNLTEGYWPHRYHAIWNRLSEPLEPDAVSRGETHALQMILEEDPVRRRLVHILRARSAVAIYRQAWKDRRRGLAERTTVRRILMPALGKNHIDMPIAKALAINDAFQSAAGCLLRTFEAFLGALKRRDARASVDTLLADRELGRALTHSRKSLAPAARKLAAALADMPELSTQDDQLANELSTLHNECEAASRSADALAETVIVRHERIQRTKNKSVWIDRGRAWTLMPGFGVDDTPRTYEREYPHPVRIRNVYSILSDLRYVKLRPEDEEA